jgi:hypothetical protein
MRMLMLLAAAVCAVAISPSALAQEKRDISRPSGFDYIVYLAPDRMVHGQLCQIPPEVACKGGPLLQAQDVQTAAGLQPAPGGS